MKSAESPIMREEVEETETIGFIVKGTQLFKATFSKMCSVHRMSLYN